MTRKILGLVSDVLIAVLLLGGIYGVNYLIPQLGIQAGMMTTQAASRDSGAQNILGSQQENSSELTDVSGQQYAGTVKQNSNTSPTDKQAREQMLQTMVDQSSNGLSTTKGDSGYTGLETEICR